MLVVSSFAQPYRLVNKPFCDSTLRAAVEWMAQIEQTTAVIILPLTLLEGMAASTSPTGEDLRLAAEYSSCGHRGPVNWITRPHILCHNFEMTS